MIGKIAVFIGLWATLAHAQTNQFRVVNGVRSQVGSLGWVKITIAAGSALHNHPPFDGSPKPQLIELQIPAIYYNTRPVVAEIENFPYTPALFDQGQMQIRMVTEMVPNILIPGAPKQPQSVPVMVNALVLRDPLTIYVWPKGHPIIKYDEYGRKLVTPAQPIFDFGIPEGKL